jgi:hypothetical protein
MFNEEFKKSQINFGLDLRKKFHNIFKKKFIENE